VYSLEMPVKSRLSEIDGEIYPCFAPEIVMEL
jgi:hypothetical protein